MHAQSLQAVQVDQCCHCEGIWFDRGELSRVVGTDQDRTTEEKVINTSTKYPCPRCNIGLCTEAYRSDPAVRIDFCARCQGIFLDKDELAKVQELAQKPAPVIEPQIAQTAQEQEQSKGLLTNLLRLFSK